MRVAIIDFDKTLVSCDTLFTILIREYFFCDISFFALGFSIILSKISGEQHSLKTRSQFKRRLLYKIKSIPQYKINQYISLFRKKLRNDVVSHILAGQYDEIIILSASEAHLIEAVLKGVLEPKTIIANILDDEGDFITCYGIRKKELLFKNYPEMERSISDGDTEIYVYTDSKSDRPIMELAVKTFFVIKNGILAL